MTEGKEYIPVSEVAEEMGIKRASLYYYIRRMQITVHRFPLNKYGFISKADAERIKAVKDRPWELDTRQQEGKSEAA